MASGSLRGELWRLSAGVSTYFSLLRRQNGCTERNPLFRPVRARRSGRNILVTGYPELEGVFLNSALVIPRPGWNQPHNGAEIWDIFPEFIDFAKSLRSGEIQNPNWYDSEPEQPN